MAKDIQTIESKFMQLVNSESGGLLASVEAKSLFIGEIKAKIFKEKDLDDLRTKISLGKSQGTTLHANFVLNLKDRICFLRVDEVILGLLAKTHGS